MKIEVDDARVTNAYASLVEEASKRDDLDKRFAMKCAGYADGFWRRYLPSLELYQQDFKDKVYLDFGSKWGLMVPLLCEMGIKKVYCVDAYAPYIDTGNAILGPRYPVEFIWSDECRIAVETATVDFVLANEVISHINPAYLNTFYSEISRIMKKGGEIIVGDGNNIAHQKTHLDLLKWYQGWENGPPTKEWKRPYLEMRQTMIARKFRDQDESAVAYVALNTSGLFGDQVFEIARKYFETGEIIERPLQPGACPTHPNWGVVMERGFFPHTVEDDLKWCGIDAKQMIKKGSYVELDTNPNLRGNNKKFRIHGTKVCDTPEEIVEFWRREHEKREKFYDNLWGGSDTLGGVPSATNMPDGDTSGLEGKEAALTQEVNDLLEQQKVLRASVDALRQEEAILAARTAAARRPTSAPTIDAASVVAGNDESIPLVSTPFVVPALAEQFQRGVFADLGEHARRWITVLRTVKDPSRELRAEFFENLLKTCSIKEYTALQRKYLAPETRNSHPAFLKYLAAVRWLDSKMVVALSLGLHESEPLDILDIGAGPGHFLYVCNFFGHTGTGLDLPYPPDADGVPHLYDGLCEFFGVAKVGYRIKPHEPLPDFGRRFDLVTSLMTTFNLNSDGSGWSTDAWRYLFHNIARDVLKPGGRMELHVPIKMVNDDIVELLKENADYDPKTFTATISDFAPFARVESAAE